MNNNFFNNPGAADLDAIPVVSRKSSVIEDSDTNKIMAVDTPSTESEFITLVCNKDFLDLLSTHFLICNDKIKGKGEDCGFEAYTCEAGIMGAFDGCGGLGAKTCPAVSDMTEAFLASRAVGAAVKEWFSSRSATVYEWDVEFLKDLIISKLELCQNQTADSGPKLRGSMVRPFPSTIAMIAFQIVDGKLLTQHIWAGDSRTYILDKNGLGQISNDDIKGEDAMSNLTRDGALTNVISVDKRFKLHSAVFTPKHPCIMFCATDGCFGYVSSPMEFEMMVLAALENATNVAEWQKLLNDDIFNRSGDDQTIAIAAFGFDDFDELKNYYADRYHMISRIVEKFGNGDPDKKQGLWETYKPNYYRYAAKKSDNNGSNTNQ